MIRMNNDGDYLIFKLISLFLYTNYILTIFLYSIPYFLYSMEYSKFNSMPGFQYTRMGVDMLKFFVVMNF